MSEMFSTGILAGYRVLDFGRYIAGPYCAGLLGQMGADVIRIERPGGSEDRYLAPITDQGEGGLFMQVNSNKRGLALDIASAEGREIVKRLVATADIVVANLPPKVLQKLGLDYESLCTIKSDIILVANSAFGSEGPHANRVGFDGVGQAMSGGIYMSGFPDQPMRSAVQYIDFGSALSAALGTLAAVMVRERTGQGQIVETSLMATALTMTNSALIEQAVVEKNRVPTGNRGQVTAPADIFKTRDGFIIVQVVGPYIFKRWAQLMGDADSWLNDPRFADDVARGENSDLLSERTAQWCQSRTSTQALAELEVNRIPSGPVHNYQEALDDPVIQSMNHLRPLEYPGAPRPAPIANAPFKLSKTDVGVTYRAPLVGEHTVEILTELGMTKVEIDDLSKQGIIQGSV